MGSAGYTRTAVAFHWLIALLIVITFPLGVYMHDLPLSPARIRLVSYHKWIGVTIFLLVLGRLLWRLTHAAPAMPGTMPAWQRRAARAGHHLLYLLMVVIPLSGWLMSSALGVQTVYLGVVPLPDLLHKDKALGDALKQVHQTLNVTLLLAVIAHVGAAVKHYWVDRDDVLSRMIPCLKPRSQSR